MGYLETKKNIFLSDIKKSRLPKEYQEVEWIQRPGAPQTNNCYIKTGIYSSTKTTVDTIEFELTIEQIHDGYHHNVFGSNYGIQAKHLDSAQYIGDPTKNLQATGKFTYAVGQSPTYNRYMICGGLLYHSKVSQGLEIYLFTMNGLNNGTPSPPVGPQDYNGSNKDYPAQFNGKLYYCKVTKNNEVIREFIPCYRKVDEEIGLYDLINNKFYSNDGTGYFEKGPNV